MANSAERRLYRDQMQKSGISIPNQQARNVPQKANPVRSSDPGLGAKTLSHPFRAGKKRI